MLGIQARNDQRDYAKFQADSGATTPLEKRTAGNFMLTPYHEELTVGSRFADRYQIISVVGRGAMGIVYQARHELMGRVVAIKTLHGLLQLDERSIKRFEREARAASRMDHHNLIAVYDFALTDQRQPYLIMEFVNGRTLYKILKKEKRISCERAVQIFSQVCDALQHAHNSGVIHRDLKPANIMVIDRPDEPDFVKVFDLGIAKIAFGDPVDREALTGTGEVCGSPVYLSPEQCRHETIDHRSDIYSLGVVMYELLTGSPPLMGETVYDTIYMHVREQPLSFKQVIPNIWIDPRLERIVLKALEKDPNNRQQSMGELKQELLTLASKAEPEPEILPPQPQVKKTPSRADSNAPTESVPQQNIFAPIPAPPQHKHIEAPTPERTRPIIRTGKSQQADPKAKTEAVSSSSPSVITKWLKGTPLEPLSQTSPTRAAVLSGSFCIVATLVIMTAFNLVSGYFSKTTQPHTTPTSAMENKSATKTRSRETENDVASVITLKRKTLKIQKPKHTITARAASPLSKQALRTGLHTKTSANFDPSSATASSTSSAPYLAPSPKDLHTASSTANANDNFWSIFSTGQSSFDKKQKIPTSSLKHTKTDKTATEKHKVAMSSAKVNPRIAHNQTDLNAENDGLIDTQPLTAKPPSQTIQPELAPTLVNDAPASPPLSAVMLYNEGTKALKTNPKLAIDKFTQALKIDPGYHNAEVSLGKSYYNYANQLRSSSRSKEAQENYQLSLEIFRRTLGGDSVLTKQAQDSYDMCRKE